MTNHRKEKFYANLQSNDMWAKIGHRWQSMMQRCYNPNNSSYNEYGGRGIGVCDEWRDKNPTEFIIGRKVQVGRVAFYQWFIAQMAKHSDYYDTADEAFKALQIDRKNAYKGYSPDNCRLLEADINQFSSYETRCVMFNDEWTPCWKIDQYTNIPRYSAGVKGLTKGLSDRIAQAILAIKKREAGIETHSSRAKSTYRSHFHIFLPKLRNYCVNNDIDGIMQKTAGIIYYDFAKNPVRFHGWQKQDYSAVCPQCVAKAVRFCFGSIVKLSCDECGWEAELLNRKYDAPFVDLKSLQNLPLKNFNSTSKGRMTADMHGDTRLKYEQKKIFNHRQLKFRTDPEFQEKERARQRAATQKYKSKILGREIKIKPRHISKEGQLVNVDLMEIKSRKNLRTRLKKLTIGVDISLEDYNAARERMRELLRIEKRRYKETHTLDEVRAKYRKNSKRHREKVKMDARIEKWALDKFVADAILKNDGAPLRPREIARELNMTTSQVQNELDRAFRKINKFLVKSKKWKELKPFINGIDSAWVDK